MRHRVRRSWPWESSRQTLALAAGFSLLFAALVANLWLTEADEPVILLTLPVILAAIGAGPAGGYVAATAAAAAYLVWLDRNPGAGSGQVVIRCLALYAVAALVSSLVGELRRRSERTEWVLERSDTGFVKIDAGGRVAALNRPAERQLGFDRTELLGMHIDSILPGVLHDAGTTDRVVRHADGSTVALEVTVEPDRTTPTVALRDVTDRRRAEIAMRQSEDRGRALVALHESEQRFRGAVETMLDCFGIFAALRGSNGEIADFTCTYVNRAAARQAGWSIPDITGERLSGIWPGGQRNAIDVYRRVVETGEPAQMDLQRIDPNSQETRVYDVRAVAFGDGYAATWRDITERMKMEAEIAAGNRELGRSNAALEEFARVVSHDLTEPLWTASLYAQALAAKPEHLSGDAPAVLERMTGALELMQERVHDLLVHAQVRGETLQREVVDTRQVAREALGALAGSVEAANATVDLGALPAVVGDRVHIRQLFQNLLSNAVKYARDDVAPVIKVSARAGGPQAQVSVEDNGIGIPEGDEERIFEVFARARGSDRPGTGIGLAVCRKIVELHGGRIWAEPNHGPGTTFHFTLPSAP
jgi:PAS domain S-box-containing protein